MPYPLADAFGIGGHEVVTLVGSGGKSTTLYRLARELQQRDGGVVVTTTTHIMAPPPDPDLRTVLAERADAAVAGCLAALSEGRIPVLGTGSKPDGRLAGVAPRVVDACAADPGVRHVVVEGDGSAGRPFKAPRAYEPVVPASSTLVIAVVGADAPGRPLTAEFIHRPERVAELTGAALGEPVTADMIATVLLHPLGPLRDVPASARSLVLVNKADTPERRQAAQEIAAALEARHGPRVVIGAVAEESPFATATA
jgi:probable selenium-dependent hydroxylase accessory protein YqeC